MKQAGKADFDLLEKKAIAWGEPKVGSAKQVRASNSRLSFVFESLRLMFC